MPAPRPKTDLDRMDALINRGRWYAARKTMRNILQSHPGHVDARAKALQIDAVLTPMVATQARLQTEALSLIEENPNSVFPRLVYASIASRRGFRRLALEWVLQMESWFPQDRRVKKSAASHLVVGGCFSEAWSRYRSLLGSGAHLGPGDLTNASLSAWEAGDKEGAREVRRRATPLQRVVLWSPRVHMALAIPPFLIAAAALVTRNSVLLAATAGLLALEAAAAQIRCPDLRVKSVLGRLFHAFGLPLAVLLVWDDTTYISLGVGRHHDDDGRCRPSVPFPIAEANAVQRA